MPTCPPQVGIMFCVLSVVICGISFGRQMRLGSQSLLTSCFGASVE